MTSLNGTPQPFGGVVTVPATSIHESIQRQAMETLKGVKEGHTMAVLSVHTQSGVNLAIAHRQTIESGVLKGGEFQIVTWVGKSGWDKPLMARPDGGVSIAFSR